MDVLNVEKSGEFVVDNDINQCEVSKNLFLSHRASVESDDDLSVDFDDKVCERRSIFVRNSLEDDTYQDELFLENPDEGRRYPEDKIIENKDPYDTASFSKNQSKPLMPHNNRDSKMINKNTSSEMAESLVGSKVPSKNHHIPEMIRNPNDQGITLSDGEYCDESEDSIFESVSVAYENRLKDLENVTQETKEIVANENPEEEFDMIDDKLVKELLEFTIGQHSNTARQSFAASETSQSQSSNLKNPSNLKIIPKTQRHALPNTLRLRESQQKLESLFKKFSNGPRSKQKIQSLTPKLKEAGLPESRNQGLATSNTRRTHPRTRAGRGTPSTSHLEKERSNSAKSQPSSSVCSTPRPAFRAGSVTDFSRKLDEDGRRKLAGKNNPYWKLRPRSSHKTSYVDEMLFGTKEDSIATWKAPWQPKSKPVRPHFCDWVWDRRKSSKP